MTIDLNQGIIAAPGEKYRLAPASTISPPRKDAPNPQQGMADPATSLGANTAATISNTACTSPLTVTSLEAAGAAGTAAASKATGIPQVVPQVVPVVPQPECIVPAIDVETMLSGPMAELGLDSAHPAATVLHLPRPAEEKKRTPPTEHDNRKLFVGGLPTDVTDHGFLDFFQQFGGVIDSVVMVDRVTKRSRGFGFVTFATEDAANSLLTAIPGKTGYVLINGKQCEVKASTPKVDDGTSKHNHHGAPGMWRTNPPHDSRGYSSRRSSHGAYALGSKPMHHNHQPRGEKQFYIDQEFNGEIDGRNFDEVYPRQMPQMNAGYQPANVYGRNFTASNPPIYQQNYQNVYSGAPPNGYTSAGAVPPSWEASYPGAPSQGYGQYPSNAASENNRYYDPYAAQQLYPNPNHFSSQYNSNSVNQTAVMGQTGYANYNSYFVGKDEDSPIPQGINSGGGFESYQASYPIEGDYNQGDSAEQYE